MTLLITLLYSGLILFCAYFSLWAIADYLLKNTLMALLFLPFSFRLGINLHTPKRFWWVSYGAEFAVLGLLRYSSPDEYYLSVSILSFVSVPITLVIKTYYYGNEIRKLKIQGGLALVMSFINGLVGATLSFSFFYTFLVSFTGMLLIMPACFLVDEYLFKRSWIPLTARLIHKPVSLRAKHILIYILLFLLNIFIQVYTPEEFHRFTLFFLSVPIILLAYAYGWQGALLGTLLNSIALTATMGNFSNKALTDLLLSLSAQTITGIFLGLAIQQQRDLNQSLSTELNRNRHLTRKLINTEEAIRQEISRELHDEIGQNITAIRMQASIMKRLEHSPKIAQVVGMIEQLSLNIYDTTKGLLNRIRPKMLDDVSLQQAIQNLFLELDLKTHGISTALFWENKDNVKLEHIQEITLYRLCQEGLNNIVKYSSATAVSLSIIIRQDIQLIIQDNGKGFNPAKVKQGFGLKGMKERVDILCGTFQLISREQTISPGQNGTTIKITLPRI
ncbi:signal transduction histidine-protein kinase/phosphatase UhpB [Rodentibacter pneumotropicus]|uniref:Signal transduction histidine-protein kinase/phosphatase UhpB n=1 Tax=Rodentibacter pneumotropicus TaxID=758 RepID=A0A4S2PV02_9PAST|nr:signal transduction histidine-protein kinase/phosphatase UhpB [Rodentibacter pneumotropicus]THA07700.1 signal transduction histidine-protein kinase/phosphatase UhpB [Rodentibacter pneumotropicus]